jgi:hypothetical protein
MGSKWIGDFITGVFGLKVPDAEWDRHFAAQRPEHTRRSCVPA